MALKSTGLGKPFGALTTNQGAAGNMGLTAEEIKSIQPFLDFDLAKVVKAPAYYMNTSAGPTYSVAGKPVDTGRGMSPSSRDVTKEYSAILNQIASRKNPVFGTGGWTGGNASSTYHDIYGGKDISSTTDFLGGGAQSVFQTGGVQFDANGKPIAKPQDQWGRKLATAAKPPTYAESLARQFQVDNPGYFQLGEDPNNRGSYNRGVIDTNNLPTLQGQTVNNETLNSFVKYDPKYGFIAPLELQKRPKPDFMDKYGDYLLLATAAGMTGGAAYLGAGGAAAAGGGAATSSGAGAGAGGTFGGIGAGSTTGSLGLSSAGATSGALGTTAAGGIGGGALGSGIATTGGAAGAFGIPAGGYAGAAIGANGAYGALGGLNSGAAAAGNTAGTAQSLGGTQAAPITQGTPTSVGLNPGSANPGLLSETGKLGSAALGGGGSGSGLLSGLGGLGGGSGGLISTLIGAGLTAYQARQMADALEVGDKSTDHSRLSGGHTSWDPSIRGLQSEALANTKQQETGLMGYGVSFKARSDENKSMYDDLYRELTSNQNPFITARVNPLKEQIAGSRGQLQRNAGLRGIGGSSFANDELSKFDFGSSRQLGDATSTATQEALGARTGVLGSMAGLNTSTLAGNTQLTNSMNTLNSTRTGIANDRLRQESLGLQLSGGDEAANRAAELQKQEQYRMMLQRLLGGTQ